MFHFQQQTFRNFNINFHTINERIAFSSGDLITGQISFDLTKKTKINSIEMTLKGMANVSWSVSGGGSKRNRRRRRQVSAKIKFFNFKSFIIQGNNAIDGSTKLEPGTHVYPFTCQVPDGDFPSSFRGAHGQIVYTLTVGIDRPWHLAKDFVTDLNFVNHIDANRRDLMASLAGSNSMTLCCLWCASGPISMTVRLERSGFVPGETVTITCEFSNASSRTATPKASLSQKQMFYLKDKVRQKMHTSVLTSVTGKPLGPHTPDVDSEMTLTIPPTTALTISNCSLIEVDYVIQVTLSVRAASDLTVLFPITLCDIPAYTAPPPYLWASGEADHS